ncbi:MAG: 3-phosphoshikimate 1-carboxyvinyltransferase [Oscillospiraceae bacterium]|nr:3-phosphoshikimate 1-carboxyvinyltransferase [Oscillospiraceae bacterium]
MNVICSPGVLHGTVTAIPSKSDAHRKLICAALSENGGFLPLKEPHCDDIAATIRCLEALGASFRQAEEGIWITPVKEQPHADLDCGESGSTLRFLLPVAMSVCRSISVTGSGRLPERPIGTLTDAMSAHGICFAQTTLPLSAKGTLTGGIYEIPGNISSQFLSGLLMALPFCEADSEIRLTTALQSAAYVDMTIRTLQQFGASIEICTEEGMLRYRIAGRQTLHFPDDPDIDGDWSNAAFWLTAGALQKHQCVTVNSLHTESIQGDKAICEILAQSGADIFCTENQIQVSGEELHTLNVSMEAIPDLLPILAVRAALGNGTSHFTNAERLRLKESDRLTATADLLRAIGGSVDEHPDGLTIYGGTLTGGTVDAKNDHRLVMAAAIAAIRCSHPVTILGAEAVNKSYPAFFEDYRLLGGNVTFE